MEDALWKSMTRSVLSLWVCPPVLAVLAPWVLSLFGAGYPRATQLLHWLCLAAPFAAVNCLFITAFRVHNRLVDLILVNLWSLWYFSVRWLPSGGGDCRLWG